jgi:Ca-activated chloride channel family protein
MHFAYQPALWLLLITPLLLWLVMQQRRRTRRVVQRLGDLALLRQTPSRCPALQRWWIHLLLVLLLFLGIIVALADPRLPYGTPRLRAGALDVVMIIDVSKSMGAEDYQPLSRLDKAREIILQMLPQLQGNRVGLVTFAGNSFRQAELTEDFTALEYILKHWVQLDSTGIGGSALGRALETGLALLPDTAERDRLLLFFSDGGDEGEHLAPVLAKIAQRGARIVAFGMGGLHPVRIPQYDPARKFMGFVQVNGQTVTTQLNEDPLQQMARTTDGLYRRATHPEAWQGIWRDKSLIGQSLTRDERRIFQPFLIVSLLAFGVQAVIARL